MASDEDLPEEDLANAIERAKHDPEFMERLAEHVERDREILDRLAGANHRGSVGDAARRVRDANEVAFRRFGDP